MTHVRPDQDLVTLANFRPELLEGISGLHFHCLCEQDVDALEERWQQWKRSLELICHR